MGIFSSIGSGIGSIFGGSDGGAIGGGLLGIGDWLLNRHDSRDAASRANKYALYASGTAHQREVADLRAAGLNPILSALGGNGAAAMPVPVGNSYNRDDNNAQEVLGYVSAQRMAQQNRREEELNRAQVNLLKEQTRKLSAEADHEQNLLTVDVNATPVSNFLNGLLARDDRLRLRSLQRFQEQVADGFVSLASSVTNRFREREVDDLEKYEDRFNTLYKSLKNRNLVDGHYDEKSNKLYLDVKDESALAEMKEIIDKVYEYHDKMGLKEDLPQVIFDKEDDNDD